jgi:hypothetical protein
MDCRLHRASNVSESLVEINFQRLSIDVNQAGSEHPVHCWKKSDLRCSRTLRSFFLVYAGTHSARCKSTLYNKKGIMLLTMWGFGLSPRKESNDSGYILPTKNSSHNSRSESRNEGNMPKGAKKNSSSRSRDVNETYGSRRMKSYGSNKDCEIVASPGHSVMKACQFQILTWALKSV